MGKHSIGRSFAFAASGIITAFWRERNLKIHTAFACAVPLVGLAMGLTALEHAMLVMSIASVIAAELLNSAIEAAVDLTTDRIHPLAKAAKDMAAGAVLVLALGSVLIGLLILGPKLLARFAQ